MQPPGVDGVGDVLLPMHSDPSPMLLKPRAWTWLASTSWGGDTSPFDRVICHTGGSKGSDIR